MVIAAAAAVLVVSNVVNNRRLAERDAAYVVSCLTTASVLVALARRDGRSWAELGLERGRAAAGLRAGTLSAAVVTAVATGLAATPIGRRALHDDRATGRSPVAVAQAAMVRVPLGTVALEEIAFRSVLPALLAPRIGRARATAITAGAFGVWHVLPSRRLREDNEAVATLVPSERASVACAVVSTALAHLGFDWLRRCAGSVVSTAVVHWATNAGGYVASALVGGRASED